nr:hypothetical protein [Candidatus Brocadiales bacterium]
MKYLLIDSMNMFFRAKHVTSRQADSWSKVGFALQITMSSVNKAYRLTGADHVVFCFEGKSWRKEFFTPYKANRAAARAALSEREQEEDELFFEAYNDLVEFWQNETNCTTLQCSIAEADDLIARWIKLHPDDQHTIVSSDSDFYQLLAENVQQYNGIEKHMITLDGIYDDNNKPVIDKKTKEPKAPPEPKWTLFEKCMRGDTSDNVFSAYPGVRKKGTKNKVGLLDAFEDRDSKGYSWNNMMLQRWTDH